MAKCSLVDMAWEAGLVTLTRSLLSCVSFIFYQVHCWIKNQKRISTLNCISLIPVVSLTIPSFSSNHTPSPSNYTAPQAGVSSTEAAYHVGVSWSGDLVLRHITVSRTIILILIFIFLQIHSRGKVFYSGLEGPHHTNTPNPPQVLKPKMVVSKFSHLFFIFNQNSLKLPFPNNHISLNYHYPY